MNQANTIAQRLPRHIARRAAWARSFGFVATAVAVAAMQAWLRVPLNPALNDLLHGVRRRVQTSTTAIRNWAV
jgi:hypothetical protein